MNAKAGFAEKAEAASPPSRPGGPRVLMTPDYRHDNPYQALLAEALEELGATVSFPRGYRRILPLRRMLGQDGGRPDVLHLHWLAPYLCGRSGAAKLVCAVRLLVDAHLVRRAGVRLVWTVHNLVEHEQTHPGIELWCRRRLARLADAIIVHSEAAREVVTATYGAPAGRISVIPHGHYRDVYGPPIPAAEARAKLGLPQEGRVFLFFGMIRPYKGVLRLLSAWAGAPELNGQHTLVIAGEARDPGHREAVQRAAQGTRNVRLFLGRVPDGRVPLFFSAADVVVLPFERALSSGSVLLAQSFGRPVVARNLTAGVEGITRPAGDDPGALAVAAFGAAKDARTGMLPLPEWPEIAARTLDALGEKSRVGRLDPNARDRQVASGRKTKKGTETRASS